MSKSKLWLALGFCIALAVIACGSRSSNDSNNNSGNDQELCQQDPNSEACKRLFIEEGRKACLDDEQSEACKQYEDYQYYTRLCEDNPSSQECQEWQSYMGGSNGNSNGNGYNDSNGGGYNGPDGAGSGGGFPDNSQDPNEGRYPDPQYDPQQERCYPRHESGSNGYRQRYFRFRDRNGHSSVDIYTGRHRETWQNDSVDCPPYH